MWQEGEGHPQNGAYYAESVHILQEIEPAESTYSLYDIVVLFTAQMLVIALVEGVFIVFEVDRMRQFIYFRLLLSTCFSG